MVFNQGSIVYGTRVMVMMSDDFFFLSGKYVFVQGFHDLMNMDDADDDDIR